MKETKNRRPSQAEVFECDATPVETRQPRSDPPKESGMPWWLTGIALVVGCVVLLKFSLGLIFIPLRLFLSHPALMVTLLLGAGMWAYWRARGLGISVERRRKP